jgi:hypothetical protein
VIEYVVASKNDMELLMQSRLEMLRVANSVSWLMEVITDEL